MKRGLNISGQFYLISAIIISAIVISIVAISNYSKKTNYNDVDSLKGELKIESAKVIDYAINNQQSQTQIYQLLISFTQNYIDSKASYKSLYFVFGNQTNITLKGFQNNPHNVSFGNNLVTQSSGAFFNSIIPSNTRVNLSIDSNSHVFNLKSGKNFYFVISKEIGGENYVVEG